ncbi:hypothetical protein Val02_87020 [Virgisporangium aliadipatigenens]|uniref:MFS transporter n=1 Tax=Virgisporangium aliadipatigenens TaxID=741659 RepID=A0A8J3YY42_9ACTN|nr:MFS transporter [Virgisporangium aliadipatigenens]GIJ51816.1 hypothetical protein Val02_87020 [Virgisporangium aliadipatigenens]
MKRLAASAMVVFVAATMTLFGGTLPASADVGVPERGPGGPVQAPANPCSVEEWQNPANWTRCVDGLTKVDDPTECLNAPTPNTPDSGMAGWFATKPEGDQKDGVTSRYEQYAYAGYNYTTYDIDCVPTTMHPDYVFQNTVANGEMLVATSIVGASNAIRERAWAPKSMWGWADPLVDQATKAAYRKVFTVFGAITLAILGLYLLWRSRQSDMNATMTTVGWAIVVMVGVTAVASWPTWSANSADSVLVSSLNVVHSAVGPPAQDMDPCVALNPAACKDNRPPAVRASGTVVDGMVYRNWLRGMLGSADTETARKYGPILYSAKAYSWTEADNINNDPSADNALRNVYIQQKRDQWMRVAAQIKAEDPDAYEHLQGKRGMDRIGAGFIAILAALFFAFFDLTASILVLLGFVIFRWAVIAAPILGTVGILRPASAGIRRLVNMVIAAVFNIVIFGAGSAVYLFAVTLVLGTDLPGWLQVVLILLTGVVGWLLLRPYRRVTQLSGKDPSRTLSMLFFRDQQRRAGDDAEQDGRTTELAALARARLAIETRLRPETRTEDTAVRPVADPAGPEKNAQLRAPVRATTGQAQWTTPNDDGPTNYAIYRPSSREAAMPTPRPETESMRR